MVFATLTADDYWSLGLAIFLVLTGAALAWAFLALAGTFRSLAALITGTQDEVLPMIGKVGGTVDRINGQLDKLDKVTDSAVDAAASIDVAVRAVTHLITAPVRKVSSVAAGLRFGGATLRKKHSWSEAVRDGKDAAARREREVDEELKPKPHEDLKPKPPQDPKLKPPQDLKPKPQEDAEPTPQEGARG